MNTIILEHETDFDGWRQAARTLVLDGVKPEEVMWSVRGEAELFSPIEAIATTLIDRNIHRPGQIRRARQNRDPAPRPRGALCCLVRAGASHHRAGGAILRAPLCRHAVVDPDARPLRALGWPFDFIHISRQQGGSADLGSVETDVAALLRDDLQSCPAQGEGHAEVLEELAGGVDD
jgi:hypothetical protein